MRMNRNRWRNTSLCLMFMISLVFLDMGCASDEEKKGKHLKRARQYVEKNELKKAVIEFKNVVKLDTKNDVAYYELGEAYLKLKQGRDAFQSFSLAVSINPDNEKAQLKMGQIFLLGRKTKEARSKAELVLEKSPDNIEALVLLSGVQIQEEDTDTAIRTLKKAASIDPNHFRTNLSLARLLVLKGDFKQAEKLYLKAISLDPESRISRIELSRLHAKNGKWNKAESVLKDMVHASGSHPQDLDILAHFYESRGNLDQAERIYLQAVESADKGDVSPLMNFGAYYARRKSYDKALEVMQEAAEIKKDDLNILLSIAQLHFDFKQMEDAVAVVDRVLEKDSQHPEANFLKGRLALIDRDFDDALECFNLVVRRRPQNSMAHYLKAITLAGKGKSKAAQQELVNTVELNPRLLDARLALAKLYLRERNQVLARQQIEAALNLAPRDIRARMLSGNLKILEQDAKGAEAVFKEVIEEAPDYVAAYVRLGLLYNFMGRQGEALENFEKALQVNPRQTDALALMVNIYIRNKKYDNALQLCRKQRKKIGEQPRHLALIEYLEGNIFLAKKDSKRAQQHFEEAIKIDPNILGSYLALARVYMRTEKIDEAIVQYEAVLHKNPKFLGGYMALGAIYEQRGEKGKAEANYRKALEIKSDFAPAANNLAWSLAERGGNIDEALGLAQIAKEQMPESPAIMDTLGWIYYIKGSYLSAIAELQDSVARDPHNPVINYHAGLAYYKNNQPNKSREFLEKALKIDQNFKGAEQARSILKDIKAISK